jgi:sulfoxide reductase catalytic subunit YedY
MLIKTQRNGFIHGVPSEITPEAVYQQRRTVIRHLATGVAGAALATWASRRRWPRPRGQASWLRWRAGALR